MKIFGNLDLSKIGQLKNVLLQRFATSNTAATDLIETARIAFIDEEKRIAYYNGTVLQRVATLSDIVSSVGNTIYVSETDPASSGTVATGSAWYKQSTSAFSIRNNDAWNSVSGGSAQIQKFESILDASIADNSSANGVRRLDKRYIVSHMLASSNVVVTTIDNTSKTSAILQHTIINANNVAFDFNRSLEESNRSYKITITSL